jgi:hypothetical protein
MAYIFTDENNSTTITLVADNDEEAYNLLDEIVISPVDFKLENIEEEEENIEEDEPCTEQQF